MPPVRARLLGVLCAAAAPVVLTGCSAEAVNSCNCCCTPVVDPAGDSVWVASGTHLLKLDADTGEIRWSRRVTRPTPGGTEELTAVSAAPEGVWVAWGRGAVLVPSREGRARRLEIAPRAFPPTLATVGGRTWLGAGRRVIRLHADGTTGPVVRFPHGVRVSGVPGAVVVETMPATVLLDPRSGARRNWVLVSMRDAWRADLRTGEVTRIDPVTGVQAGGSVHIEQLAAIVETPDGGAYATASNHELSVLRLDPEGPRILWRTPITPG